ncbi:MAG: cobalamin biosynthesis protein CobW [Rhodospirillaceae bacterium]|nr:cobalamin biosynthesis protein CobW [Rhodospirillaceae bacterium]|tara:strand:- start:1131 stop:2162 length:1032 start_codon:yes stop_codon:yes gene_type:complete
MAEKIPATVITGFLGAGKTSLIRHLVENNQGRRLAFLINEFGDLGIDRELLLGCGIEGCDEKDVVELANGCICCTVADDFLPAMESILARDEQPDHIVIETSGLALPKPLIKAFNWPEIRSKVTVDGVVTVVDAAAVDDGRMAPDPIAVQAARENDPALDHEDPLEEVFEDQLSCADVVVLNKCDLVDDKKVPGLREKLAAQLRDGTKVVGASHAQLDPTVLLGLAAASENDLDNRPSHHDDVDGEHDHDDFESFVVDLGPIEDIDAFEARLAGAIQKHDILRIKGFLDRPGKARREAIQGVGLRLQRYFDRDWRTDENRNSQIVVIGLAGLDRPSIEYMIRG